MVRLSVAIPDSALSDYSTKLDKSRKVSQFARCAAMFGIDAILVYRDGDNTADRSLLVSVLRFMETPQFLRKGMFPKMSDLKFVGVLHPLGIPSHNTSSNPETIKTGDIREGLVVSVHGRRYLDVGIGKLLHMPGMTHDGRVSVRFAAGHPDLRPVLVSPDQIPHYRGYAVHERGSINQTLREWKGRVIVATRTGSVATPRRISRYTQGDVSTLVVFGSPDRDVYDIAGGRLGAPDMIRLNFFPHQQTRTIRLEEAVLGALAILNMGVASA